MKKTYSRKIYTIALVLFIIGVVYSLCAGELFKTVSSEYVDFIQNQIRYPSLYGNDTFTGSKTNYNFNAVIIVNLINTAIFGVISALSYIIEIQETKLGLLYDIKENQANYSQQEV